MSAEDIQLEVIAGLADARIEAGGVGGGGIVEKRVLTGGDNDPIYPTEPTESWVELINCVFATVDANLIDGTLVKSGDIFFVASATESIEQNDVFRRDGLTYNVKTVAPSSPFGAVIAYTGTARNS